MVGCNPADAGALQTCPVIQGFPGSIQEARAHVGVKPPLLAQELFEQRVERRQEKSLSVWRSYPWRGGGGGWMIGSEQRIAGLNFGFRKLSQTADTGNLFSVHYFFLFNKLLVYLEALSQFFSI